LDRSLGGPQSRSGCFGEEKNLSPAGIRTPAVQPVERVVEGVAEEWVKVKSHGRSERHFVARMDKEHRFVRKFPGFARSSF
jgi:hypothetical protein